jgi:predicted ATP-binding protein involved in virulence
MAVYATGSLLGEHGIRWGQTLPVGKKKVSNKASKQAMAEIESAYERVQQGENVLLPVIAYYGAGRTWLPHNQRTQLKAKSNGPANRWEALYDCLNDRIRLSDLNAWFRAEAIERGNRGGNYRPGFEAVLRAVHQVVPGSGELEYDGDREEIVLSIDGNRQPFSNLSAGQRSLFALVGDIAIKMVTQNNYLVPPDTLTDEDQPLPRVLAQTPGVVLIDELDVHLHPKWQRRIAADLKRVFPSIQFIATTHSPQVIGEMQPCEVCLLRQDGSGETPSQSFGMDSNWILQVLMETEELDSEVKNRLDHIFELLKKRQYEEAEKDVLSLRRQIGNSEALQRAASTLERMRLLEQ